MAITNQLTIIMVERSGINTLAAYGIQTEKRRMMAIRKQCTMRTETGWVNCMT